MRACSVRPLPALGPGALGKAAHRHFPQPFYFFPNFIETPVRSLSHPGQTKRKNLKKIYFFKKTTLSFGNQRRVLLS